MEAYASAKSGSNDFDPMHSEASNTFPGAEMVNASALPGEENATMLWGAKVDYSITRSRGGTVVQVTYRVVKKEPVERENLRLPPGNITKVKIIKKPWNKLFFSFIFSHWFILPMPNKYLNSPWWRLWQWTGCFGCPVRNNRNKYLLWKFKAPTAAY